MPGQHAHGYTLGTSTAVASVPCFCVVSKGSKLTVLAADGAGFLLDKSVGLLLLFRFCQLLQIRLQTHTHHSHSIAMQCAGGADRKQLPASVRVLVVAFPCMQKLGDGVGWGWGWGCNSIDRRKKKSINRMISERFNDFVSISSCQYIDVT